MSFDLTDWKKGDALAASHLQEPVTALRRMLSAPDAQMPPVKSSADSLGFHFIITLGQIVNHGPNGEVDLTDERYWVRPQYIQGATQRDDPITLADVAPPDEYTGETVFPDQNILAVTNLPELEHGTHTLTVGRYVWFFKVADGADDPVEHAVMSESGDVVVIPVRLTQTGGSLGNKTTSSSWTYTVKDITNTTTITTGASPSVARPHGTLAAATYGIGYYAPDGSGFVLLHAFEITGTGGC